MDRVCEGRVALVTGASRGLGAAIAERLAEEGAHVGVSARTLEHDDRQEGSLRETVQRITDAGGTAVAVQCDLSKSEERQRMVAETQAALGPIDILVNNAAATFLIPFEQFSDPVHTGGFTVYGMVKAALDRFSTALAAELHSSNIAVNSLAPWDNVATPGAGYHDLVDGFALEGPEWVAEAALVLCSAQPQKLTGRIAFSQPFLGEHQIRPKVR